MSLGTIGSIATFITNTFDNLSAGISGNMVEIVDQSRQHVANFTGDVIGSNSISAKYEPAIIDFSKASVVELSNAGAGGDDLRLAELTVNGGGETMTAEQYRLLGDMKLKSIGRKVRFARSIS